jgi:IS1 family transposase
MNILSRDKQIDVIAALTEGVGIRTTSRLTGVNRETVGTLALRVGRGCAELHDRLFVGIRTGRIEVDELWSFVGKKARQITSEDSTDKGDQYTFIALAASSRAIIAYQTGKRDGFTTNDFIRDLSERVIGHAEISSDGFRPYLTAIRAAFGARADHGMIVKTYNVTNLATPEAARRYSPAQVVAVSREPVTGMPTEISTSYVERSNLSIRMASRRFTRLTNGFSKKLENHLAAVALYVAHYNLCRPHETLSTSAARQITPAMAAGLSDHVWSIGELLDAALAVTPPRPVGTPSARRRRFLVIEGGRS